jgi:hypothetical protein
LVVSLILVHGFYVGRNISGRGQEQQRQGVIMQLNEFLGFFQSAKVIAG